MSVKKYFFRSLCILTECELKNILGLLRGMGFFSYRKLFRKSEAMFAIWRGALPVKNDRRDIVVFFILKTQQFRAD